jgi:hypoxanthine phosphoribosyltransferase
MKKLWYSWHDIERMCHSLVNQMYGDGWRPDYIVGITRGGNVPATILSNMLDIPADSLLVSFRDNGNESNESNCIMAEDAFGYGVVEDGSAHSGYTGSVPEKRKNILVIDDINDTGRTFSSEFDLVRYHATEVNKADDDVWVVYPWENVGLYDK